VKTDVTDIPHRTAQQGPDNQPVRPEKILPRMLMRRLSSPRAELANRYGRHTYQIICMRHFPQVNPVNGCILGSRHGARGAQLLCSLCVPSVIYRRLAAAHSIYPERLPPPHRCAVRRLARAQAPRPKMRQVAPLPRLHTELAAPAASRRTMLRHVAACLQACEP
jgi:hypothetical protein